jgi:hypothetical protein
MDEIARKQAMGDFFGFRRDTKQDKPARLTRQEQERKERGARLVAVFANQSDREELILYIQDVVRDLRAITLAEGLRIGYLTAEAGMKLKKGKPQHKAIAKIARVLTKNPKATTREVFLALDNADIPLYRSKSVPKYVRLWSEIVNEPYYKNLVSRVRKQVATATQLLFVQNLLVKMDKNDKDLKDEEMRTPSRPLL